MWYVDMWIYEKSFFRVGGESWDGFEIGMGRRNNIVGDNESLVAAVFDAGDRIKFATGPYLSSYSPSTPGIIWGAQDVEVLEAESQMRCFRLKLHIINKKGIFDI